MDAKYGEPWTVGASGFSLWDRLEKRLIRMGTTDLATVEQIERIVACVNACTDLEDPAAFVAQARADAEWVREMRAALNQIASWGEGPGVSGRIDEPIAAQTARAVLARHPAKPD